MTPKHPSIWSAANPTVRLHQPLIFAQYGYMEARSMKLFLLMLAKWDIDAPLETPIRIRLDELLETTGGKQYALVKKSIREVKNKITDLQVEEKTLKGRSKFAQISVVEYLEYVDGEDYIEGRFTIRIRDYLKALIGRFTHAELREMFALKTYYAIRLYMIGKCFFDGYPEREMGVDDLRRMLVGEGAQYYDTFKYFNKEVIKPAVKAIATTSGALSVEPVKNGRQVVAFILRPAAGNGYRESVAPVKSPLPAPLEALLTGAKVYITPAIRERYQQEPFDEGYVRYLIDRSRSASQPPNFIYKALLNGLLLSDYRKLTRMPSAVPASRPPAASPAAHDYERISLEQARQMYENERAEGKMKFPFTGFVKAIKTGRRLLVEGFQY